MHIFDNRVKLLVERGETPANPVGGAAKYRNPYRPVTGTVSKPAALTNGPVSIKRTR